ncbi:IPT/TIG domain-containing protein [bacterium]|nr:IPT/TIG domain-containing protein [bacterium]
MRAAVIGVVMMLLVAGCGGGGSLATSPLQTGDQAGQELEYVPVVVEGTLLLGVLKDVNGVPAGVRITWVKSTSSKISGYYIYRDTSDSFDGEPTQSEKDNKRVSGFLTHDTGAGTTQSWDNSFSPSVGSEYWYAVTAVNDTSDESDFSDTVKITIAQHTITSITTSAVSIGDSVTITGTYFGSSRGSDVVYFTDADGTTDVEAASYTSWTPTEIVVTVPYGAADGVIGVKVGSATVYSTQSIAYNEPAVTVVNPTEDWVNHNDVTFTGTDFGPAPGSGGTDSTVYFGATAAATGDITSWTTTEIKVKVPASATGLTVNVYVDVAGNESNTTPFTILPHINSLDDYNGSTGQSVTLTGTNFGSSSTPGSVTVEGNNASVGSWANTSVTIAIPANAVDGDVVLTRDDSKVTEGVGFDVVPTISSLSPTRRIVGDNLTINGSGFGDTRGTSTVTFNGGSGVEVTEGSAYVSWSANQIVVEVPDGAASGTVTVHIGDADITGGSDYDSVTSSGTVYVILAAPDITDLEQL